LTLKIVGAGLGRTGTHSLKLALEQLLDGPCYHMIEVFGRPDDIPVWQRAAEGEMPDWHALFRDYRAVVDWPVAAFWRQLADAYPEAPILLSTRDTAGWWKSASNTIFQVATRPIPDDPVFGPQMRMINALLANTFTPDVRDEAAACAAYERHNAEVRATIPADRLVEWHPGDGWGPLCAALGVPEPSDPFPHVNTTDEFRAMVGLDQG
jgi:sulfotransferase family protein